MNEQWMPEGCVQLIVRRANVFHTLPRSVNTSASTVGLPLHPHQNVPYELVTLTASFGMANATYWYD